MTKYITHQQELEFQQNYAQNEAILLWMRRVQRLFGHYCNNVPNLTAIVSSLGNNDHFVPLFLPNDEYRSNVDLATNIPPFHLEWGQDGEGEDLDDTGDPVVDYDEQNIFRSEIIEGIEICPYYAVSELATEIAQQLADTTRRSIVVVNAVNGWTYAIDPQDDPESYNSDDFDFIDD